MSDTLPYYLSAKHIEQHNQMRIEQEFDDNVSEVSLGSFYDSDDEDPVIYNNRKYANYIYNDFYKEYKTDQDEEYIETASERKVLEIGYMLREQARQRIQDNPEAYEGIGDKEKIQEIDFDAEDFAEQCDAFMKASYSRGMKERDLYLANGGLTNDEMKYLYRRTARRTEDVVLEIEEIEDK